jgi:hypothetical protein
LWIVNIASIRCQSNTTPLKMGAFAAYDRKTQCLEVRFKWKAVQQYRPVPLAVVGEIWKARPMNVVLDKLVMKNRRIQFDEVRSEGKVLVSMLRGWRMLQKPTSPMRAQ